MSRSTWLPRSLAMLALTVPIALTPAGPAAADHRHGGWHNGHSRHHGHHWRGHHHRRHSGVSGLFIFDFSPPRRVIAAPPPVYVQPAPVYVQPPPLYVQPAPVYVQPPPRAYCREYTSTVMVNGRPVETYGTACMQPDGSWRIVSLN